MKADTMREMARLQKSGRYADKIMNRQPEKACVLPR